MARLTEKQKQKIIARYVECGSYRQVAREFGVSWNTVKSYVNADKTVAQRCAEKKEEITLDMFRYMEGQRGNAQKLLSNIVEALNDPQKLAKANVRDLATAYGIIFDKFTQAGPKASDELLKQARDILGNIDGAIK